MSENEQAEPAWQLDFRPAWARQPADSQRLAAFAGRGAGSERQPWPAGRRGAGGRPRDAGRGRRGPAAISGDRRPAPSAPPRLTAVPVPEQRGLQPLARLLARTARAYPLMEVAAMFLRRPQFHAFKLAALPDAAGESAGRLFQCRECLAVGLSRAAMETHALARHFDLFYEREEIQAEPPKGKFFSVTRCGLSGVLLGPPNFHGFNERLQELHRERFAHLSLAEYRAKLVNETDPALIEQWKQEFCRRSVYRARPPAAARVFQRRAEAESDFRERVAPGLVKAGERFVLPGAAGLDDPEVRDVVQRAREREQRVPRHMAAALALAFRRHKLALFRTPDRMFFVSAVSPAPIDPAGVLPLIREILERLAPGPGPRRTELVAALRPGAPPDSPGVAAIISQLRWLIDKGHVIEFADGRLAAPRPDAARTA